MSPIKLNTEKLVEDKVYKCGRLNKRGDFSKQM